MEPELLLSDIVPMFTHLANDDQDSVRILAAENCSSLATLLPSEDSTTHVVPIVCKFGEDKSWRVRYMVCKLYLQLMMGDVTADHTLLFCASLLRRLRSSCARFGGSPGRPPTHLHSLTPVSVVHAAG